MRDKQVNKLLRAADQRLTAAGVLFQNDMFLESMYLAGYVPECGLKAVILSRVPVKDRIKYQRRHFRGASAHRYEYLKRLLRELGVGILLPVARSLRIIESWSTDLRYEVGRKSPEEAGEFLSAARVVRDWVRRSL
jgi:HEPN domain-containing protein